MPDECGRYRGGFSILGKAGYGRTEQIADADVIMANTCSIRDNAEQRILRAHRAVQHLAQGAPGVVTGILGCMAERLKDELLNTGKVDLVAGPDSYRRLPSMIEEALCGQPQIDVLLSREGDLCRHRPRAHGQERGVGVHLHNARVQQRLLLLRGALHPRGGTQPRLEVHSPRGLRLLLADGYREVTLLGQNVDSYNYEGTDFAALLKTVAEAVPGCAYASRPPTPRTSPTRCC